MLCLTRKKGEAVVIGTDIVVRVLELSDGRAMIGIDAPRGVQVWREEIANGDKNGGTETETNG